MQRPPNRTGRWMAVGLAAVMAWVLFLATSSQMMKMGEMAPPSLETGGVAMLADFRWTLLDLDGNKVDFASFKGKPILLNLWATWCGPCLQEMPSISSLAANPALKTQGVVFVCVSTDDSAAVLKAFLKDKAWGMTILRATSIPPAFQTDGIPATFLIAPDGRIATAEVGSAQWDDPSVVSFLQKLAKPAG